MSTNALDRLGRNAPPQVGQATVVEQARAVAEVAAAVQVAQQFPRSMEDVKGEVVMACQTISLARKAFYSVPNRGEGKSVHLARELARMWGNFQSGVHELRRDDEAGISEVQAFAWDVERNTRSTRTFISPHQRMKGRERVALVDLNDVYLSNQNTGARAVRECIFAALPNWLVDLAEDECRKTLARGDGKPVEQRARDAVAAFARLNVTQQQLEQRITRPMARWDGQDIGSLEVVFRSIQSGETTVDEQFETARVTADEIRNRPAPQPRVTQPAAASASEPGPPPDDRRRRRLFALLGDAHITGDDARHRFATDQLGHDVTSYRDLSAGDVELLIAFLEAEAERAPAADVPVEEPPGEDPWSRS